LGDLYTFRKKKKKKRENNNGFSMKREREGGKSSHLIRKKGKLKSMPRYPGGGKRGYFLRAVHPLRKRQSLHLFVRWGRGGKTTRTNGEGLPLGEEKGRGLTEREKGGHPELFLC